MQVFKLYFKILRSYFWNVLMYTGIFLGVFLGIMVPQMAEIEREVYTQSKCDFAVFDYDNSSLSHAVIHYLQTIHNLEEIKEDETETIQDELYAGNVHCVIRVNDGFEEAFLQGEGAEFLEVFSISNIMGAILFEENLQGYLNVINTYQKAGFEIEETIAKASSIMDTSIEVEFAEEKEKVSAQPLSYFYSYLNWIFIAICVNSMSVVLLSLDKKNVRDRIQSSPYPFLRMNLETILGVLTTGFFICSFFNLIGIMIYPKELLQAKGIFYILNAFCTMTVALSFTFLVSKLTNKPQVISLMSNVIGLGMAFLCGVFVPLEVLSKTVIQIAHFLPAYWNVRVLEVLEGYQAEDRGTVFLYMGIQLLFAVTILCIGMVVARRKHMISE